MSSLKQRIVSTVALVTFLLIAIQMASAVVFTAVLWLLMSIGLYEFWTLMRLHTSAKAFAMASVGGLVFLWSEGLPAVLVFVTTMQALFLCYLHEKRSVEGSFTLISGQIVSFLYFFGLAYMILGVRLLPDGAFWVTWTILTVKVGDMGAYLIGRKWGRHKMAPNISPGKTWEGAVANLVFSCVAGSLMWSWFHAEHLYLVEVILLSLGLNILAQLGDLWESLLKRDKQIKDSGRVIPGMGGFMDVLDSLVFSFPLANVVLGGILLS